ncbi:hypothetical protein SVAN01_05106 [Stagonosporopsis vannaccii]|nr:hypothetical protein SVAN01_05106 [Stagonosporopsis vannaccii]
MPVKKKDTPDADVGSGEGTWKWTPENDRTLFLLILGRGALGKEEYEKIAAALSPNVNWNGVRQRISKFRGEQKKKFEELGWDVAGDTPVKGKATATPRKHKAGGEEGEGVETPSKGKKTRAKQEVKSEEVVANEEKSGEVDVKEEDEEGV